MNDFFVEDIRDFSTPWFSPVKSQSQNVKSDSQLWQTYRALAGSPFESSDDSDSSSEGDDDTMSLGSSDALSNDVAIVPEGFKTLGILESNALGLIFMEDEEVLATEEVATFTLQAEGLQAPRNHQGGRSCGRPNQKHHAQEEHVAFQSDGATDDTLVRRFPQDFVLRADVSDTSGPKVFQGMSGSPFEKAHSGCDHGLRAPRMKVIPLPEEEDLLYSGPALGGWLTGALDGVPKIILGDLDCLDIGLPSPFEFAMED